MDPSRSLGLDMGGQINVNVGVRIITQCIESLFYMANIICQLRVGLFIVLTLPTQPAAQRRGGLAAGSDKG